jgi:uncharacterized protein (UPF0248 family)
LTLRDVLNRILWDPRERVSEYEVTYIHRGASGNMRTIPVSDIEEVRSSWFLLRDPNEGLITIPFHRVLEVREISSGKVVWQKRLRGRSLVDH